MSISYLFNNFQSIATVLSTVVAVVGVIIASPRLKRMCNVFRSKTELSTAYYQILNQFNQERSLWQETMKSLKNTTEALHDEMNFFKERLIRIEGELERLIPKYRDALHFIHDLKSHIVDKDMPKTPPRLQYDLEQISHENKG